MADFKTHLSVGVISGLGMSAFSLYSFSLSITQAFSIFVMGAIGSILPDLDSDSGKPLAFLFGTISVIIPALLLDRITLLKPTSPEFLVSYFVCAYFLINYLVCGLIKKITVHRGIMHSIPFAVLSGEIGYLLFISSGRNIGMVVGISVFIGCLLHLIFDELHSFSLKFGFIPTRKRSSGTAFKMRSGNHFVTLFIYCLILGITKVIVSGEANDLYNICSWRAGFLDK